jgi:hypothetical protein
MARDDSGWLAPIASGFLRRQDHMKIAQKLKIALDETRMLVLGAQILIGVQFRGVFQDLTVSCQPPRAT